MLLAAILTCFAQRSNAQTAKVTDRLVDGSLIVTVDGVAYRALTAAQIRKVQEIKIERDAAVTENAVLKEQLAAQIARFSNLDRERQLAETQISLEQKRADEFRALFENEKALRIAAEKLRPKTTAIERILKHPAVQVAIVAVSVITAARARR